MQSTLTRAELDKSKNKFVADGLTFSRDVKKGLDQLYVDCKRGVKINGQEIKEETTKEEFKNFVEAQFGKEKAEALFLHYSQGPQLMAAAPQQGVVLSKAEQGMGVALTIKPPKPEDISKNIFIDNKDGKICIEIETKGYPIEISIALAEKLEDQAIVGYLKDPVTVRCKLDVKSGFELEGITIQSSLMRKLYLKGELAREDIILGGTITLPGATLQRSLTSSKIELSNKLRLEMLMKIIHTELINMYLKKTGKSTRLTSIGMFRDPNQPKIDDIKKEVKECEEKIEKSKIPDSGWPPVNYEEQYSNLQKKIKKIQDTEARDFEKSKEKSEKDKAAPFKNIKNAFVEVLNDTLMNADKGDVYSADNKRLLEITAKIAVIPQEYIEIPEVKQLMLAAYISNELVLLGKASAEEAFKPLSVALESLQAKIQFEAGRAQDAGVRQKYSTLSAILKDVHTQVADKDLGFDLVG